MHHVPSAERYLVPAATIPYRYAPAGALDALANFWFKRIEFADVGAGERPEINLEMGADMALACCLMPYELTNEQPCVEATFEDGFNVRPSHRGGTR